MILLCMMNTFPVFSLINILLYVVVDLIHSVDGGVCGRVKSIIPLVLTVIQNILI